MPTPTSTPPLDLRRLLERSDRVFPPYPHVAHFFPAASIEDARVRLGRAIERGDGPGLIVGGPGSGKSLLLQVLAAQFHERFDVVLLACARVCTRRALLQAILFELGLPYQAREEGELRLGLLDHLLSVVKCPEGLLVLVDEAQALPPALLDELRVMTNLVRGGVPRMRLVLAGSAALEESFASPELESFSQRLSARCYLAPFSREETKQFIRAQIAAAGGAPDEIFAPDALAAVFDATDGVPRLINQLCDRALLLGSSEGRDCIDRDVVQAAWADMQQLPTPWESPSEALADATSSNVVEFGSLYSGKFADDELEEDECVFVEPTDLDSDDELPVGASPIHTIADHAGSNHAPDDRESADEEMKFVFEENSPPAQPPAVDPFAEKFDEEEIVLDSFAAWDDMFRRETPRVENRRDPNFADLVQNAIEASPGFMHRLETPAFKVIEAHAEFIRSSQEPHSPYQFDEEFADTEQSDDPDDDSPMVDFGSDIGSSRDRQSVDYAVAHVAQTRPALRLADVADPKPLQPIPLVTPSASSAAAPTGVSTDASEADASNWLSQVAGNFFREQPATQNLETTRTARSDQDATPVLVVEDDATLPDAATPTVRREELRDLFSRLRGD
jgi:type II secretory pathway predicted ATPase ExeA